MKRTQAQHDDFANQIAEVLKYFMQFHMHFQAILPNELAKLHSRLHKIPSIRKPERAVRYDLFHLISLSLYRRQVMTMGEISHALLVPLSTTTGLVDWLVKNGYAQRLPDPEDRRVVRVTLTDTGRKFHEITESYISRYFEQIMSHLTVKERNTLFTIIRKLASASKGVKII